MSKLRLTDAAIQRIKPPSTGQVDHYDLALPGFGLRLSHKGAKSFFLMKRIKGKMRRFTLGRYPAVSLAEARRMAEAKIETISAGLDPAEVEIDRRKQADAAAALTFHSVAETFLEKRVRGRLRPSTCDGYVRALLGNDTKILAGLPISSIKRSDLASILDTISRRSPSMANLTFAYLASFFNWCVKEDLIEQAPTERLSKPCTLEPRARFLDADEIRQVWQSFDMEPGPFGTVYKLELLTGQRRGEIAELTWNEVKDLGGTDAYIALPGGLVGRTKNRRPHIVPLAPVAAQLIKLQPRHCDFVFSTTGYSPISGFSRANRRIYGRVNEVRAAAGLAPIESWRPHDLRRTMSTLMNEQLAVPPHIVEAIINHVSGLAKAGVAGVYNRALYLEDRRKALGAWADYICRLTGTSEPWSII